MKNSKVLKTILVISGLIGLGVGLTMLLMPVGMYASVNVDISNQVSLLSDIRGMGATFTALGILVIMGAFKSQLTFTATLIATFIYLAYAASRVFSFVMDGMPHGSVLIAGMFETVLGLSCLFALIKYR